MTRAYRGAELVSLGMPATSALGSGPTITRDTTGSNAVWALPARYSRTPAETVAMSDVTQLEQRLVEWLGGR